MMSWLNEKIRHWMTSKLTMSWQVDDMRNETLNRRGVKKRLSSNLNREIQ